jgi:hypothetical protein
MFFNEIYYDGQHVTSYVENRDLSMYYSYTILKTERLIIPRKIAMFGLYKVKPLLPQLRTGILISRYLRDLNV